MKNKCNYVDEWAIEYIHRFLETKSLHCEPDISTDYKLVKDCIVAFEGQRISSYISDEDDNITITRYSVPKTLQISKSYNDTITYDVEGKVIFINSPEYIYKNEDGRERVIMKEGEYSHVICMIKGDVRISDNTEIVNYSKYAGTDRHRHRVHFIESITTHDLNCDVIKKVHIHKNLIGKYPVYPRVHGIDKLDKIEYLGINELISLSIYENNIVTFVYHNNMNGKLLRVDVSFKIKDIDGVISIIDETIDGKIYNELGDTLLVSQYGKE